jgi:hypothetical protein
VTPSNSVQWHKAYTRLMKLEGEIQELRALLLALKPEGFQPISQHPVALGGVWTGADIPDELIRSARQSLFPYENKFLPD